MQIAHYLIIGSGRLATHFCHYLDQLDLDYKQWSRKSECDLNTLLKTATHIVLLISDSAIDSFIDQHLQNICPTATIVHCSGCLLTQQAYSAHPLQTFSPQLYSAEDYQQIPFIIEAEGPSFESLLPGLPNPNYAIPKADKSAYHAYCVMANNFTTLLWQEFINTMQEKWNIDKSDLNPFLHRTLQNLLNNHQSALTGPIARNDKSTINSNLNALKNERYQDIYQTFVDVHCEEKTNENN